LQGDEFGDGIAPVLGAAATAPACGYTGTLAWVLASRGGGQYNGKELFFSEIDTKHWAVSRDGRVAALRELKSLGLVELRRGKGRGAPFSIILLRTD
jgi:hypothetical protein